MGWQESPWLAGQLIAVLDANLRTTLGGQSLRYDSSLGSSWRSIVTESPFNLITEPWIRVRDGEGVRDVPCASASLRRT